MTSTNTNTITVYFQKNWERAGIASSEYDLVGVWGGVLDNPALGEFANYSEHISKLLGQDVTKLGMREAMEALEACEQVLAYSPVYSAEQHGKTRLSTSHLHKWPFIGFAVITRDAVEANGHKMESVSENHAQIIREHIAELDQATQGNVFGYVLQDKDGFEVDACWNFVGADLETNGMLNYVPVEFHERLRDIFEHDEMQPPMPE